MGDITCQVAWELLTTFLAFWSERVPLIAVAFVLLLTLLVLYRTYFSSSAAVETLAELLVNAVHPRSAQNKSAVVSTDATAMPSHQDSTASFAGSNHYPCPQLIHSKQLLDHAKVR